MTQDNPRILIVGTGRHGSEAARIAHRLGWNVVAALNRAGDKIGQDIGEIGEGKEPIGLVVQDLEDVDLGSLEIDLAITAMTDRLELNWPVYERLLSAGINVLCHGSEAYFPTGTNPEIASKIDALAKQNTVTFTGTGVWDHSRIWAGILAAGPCQSIAKLRHISRTRIDIEPYTQLVGTGLSIEEFASKFNESAGPIDGIYRTIPNLVMHALGYTVTKVTERREPVLFDHPVYCTGFKRDIPAGECAGMRIIAEVQSAEGVRAEAIIELRLFEEGEVDNMEWQITGDPDSDIVMARHDSLRTSSMCLIKRARDVIKAPPGIQLITQLGPMKPQI